MVECLLLTFFFVKSSIEEVAFPVLAILKDSRIAACLLCFWKKKIFTKYNVSCFNFYFNYFKLFGFDRVEQVPE
jgi:hypothetical protein